MKLETVFSEQELREFVSDISSDLSVYCLDNKLKTVVFIVVLCGSTVFAADLLRRFTTMVCATERDLDILVDYIEVSQYREGMEPGQIYIDQEALKRIRAKYRGIPTIILDEIVDRGRGITALLNAIDDPENTHICALINKTINREYPNLAIEFSGVTIGKNHPFANRFLYGYGMDLKQNKFRNLPYVAAMPQEPQE